MALHGAPRGVLTRAEARTAAKNTAEAALADAERRGAADLAREERSRLELESQHAELAGILVPLVIAGAAIWIGLLAFGNARQRSGEIGILRAIGVRSRQVMLLFLARNSQLIDPMNDAKRNGTNPMAVPFLDNGLSVVNKANADDFYWDKYLARRGTRGISE